MTDKDALLLWMVKRGYWSNTCGDTIDEMLDELEFCLEEDRQCEKQFRGLAYESGRNAGKREWQGLTEEDAIDLLPVMESEYEVDVEMILEFAKAIEAKLKEKNT